MKLIENKYSFVNVIEANLSELFRMNLSEFTDKLAYLYHKVLVSYLRCDIDGIKNAIRTINKENSSHDFDQLLELSELRLQIRSLNKEYLKSKLSYNFDFKSFNPILKGELYFLLSTAAAIINNQELACEYSREAAAYFKMIGANRKTVRSLLNAFSSECAFKPKKNYLSDLYFIYNEAKKVRDFVSIGGTLGNISQEYQKMGLYDAALKYSTRAIAIYSKNSPGSLDYHLQLIHRAHLHLEMGAMLQAKVDCDMGLACDFPEVHAAFKVISENFPHFTNIKNVTSIEDAPFNWKDKSIQNIPKRASKHESLLLELLMKRPHSKIELCELLYGNKIDKIVAENRLQNLFSRIKKWNSNLIVCQNSKYFLSERPTASSLFAGLS